VSSGLTDAAKTFVVASTPTDTTFTVTTVSTAVLNNATVVTSWREIKASGNIHSVANADGSEVYHINLNTTMPDVEYAISVTPKHTTGAYSWVDMLAARVPTTVGFSIQGAANYTGHFVMVYR
jgi:hypothetical protein